MQIFLDWVNAYPQWAGIVVFVVAASESLVLVGILVPGIVFMLGVGALIGLGALEFWSCFFWAAAGAIAGDGFSYWLGMHYHKQIQAMWPLSRYPEMVPRGERFFRKHGGKSVFFGRFIGPIRAVIPAVAGIMEMPPLQFYFVNVLSAVVWAPVVLLPGIVFGKSVEAASGASTRIIILIIIAGVLGWLLLVLARRIISLVCEKTRLELTGAYSVLAVLLTVGIISFAIMVSNEKSSFDARPGFGEMDERQWWDGGWRELPAGVPGGIFGRDRPLNIQWLSRADDIGAFLLLQGWQTPVPLLYANTFLWLVPDIEPERQPVMPRYYSWNLPDLTYIQRDDEKNVLMILRLWTSGDAQGEASLYMGYVAHAVPARRLGLLFYPEERSGNVQDLQRLIHVSLRDMKGTGTRYKLVSREHEAEMDDVSGAGENAILLINTSGVQDGP